VVANRFWNRNIRMLFLCNWVAMGLLSSAPSGGQEPALAPAPPETPASPAAGSVEVTAKPRSKATDSAAADPAARLRSDLEYLSSDTLAGREPGTDGIDLAANHIANAFRELGLNTELVDGRPFQPFEIKLGAKATSAEENYLTLQRKGQARIRVELDKGMRPLAIGASGKAQGKLVFAGYGITAPQLNYDDYAGLDVSGAIVMLIRKMPSEGGDANPFNQRANAKFAFFATKVQNAVDHGAAAVLIVNDPASVQAQIDQLQRRLDGERQRLKTIEQSLADAPEGVEKIRRSLRQKRKDAEQQLNRLEEQLVDSRAGLLGVDEAGGVGSPAKIPVLSLSREVANDLLSQVDAAGEASPMGIDAIEVAINDDLQPRSRAMQDCHIQLQTGIDAAIVTTSNVIGTLPGKGDLAGESIVVGAHYDHVGMGGYGSLAPGTIAIHNGADDNGSGTVTMMEVARRVTARVHDLASHRRLVFIAFSGEERGLLGSKHYVAQPLFPLETTAAMINLDMVGRLKDNELTVYGTGTATEFDGLLDRLNQQGGFNLLRVASGYGPSDHTSFYEAKVPVLFFFTGLHNDYHRPSDDFDKIDLGGLARITDIVTDATAALATEKRPTYQATEPGARIRRQLTVFLGIRMRNEADSVFVSEVYQNSPAMQAGFQIGDQVAQIAGKTIRHSDGILEALRKRRPGDQLKVDVKRGAETVQLKVLLGERP